MESLLEFNPDYKRLKNLIVYLSSQKGEEDWYDFKVNNADPDKIGEYVSALSNAATLCGHNNGYLIWGVSDIEHELVGTTFLPSIAKKGNEELENYLTHMSTPSLALTFYHLEVNGKSFVILQIPKARIQPTKFKGVASVRIGSNNHLLSKYPEKEMKLWATMASSTFETEFAKEELDEDEVFAYIDPNPYYSRKKIPVPSSKKETIDTFIKEHYLGLCDSGKLAITNLGALLFAKDLYEFTFLSGKAIRVIRYQGKSRVNAISETEFHQGYALMFDEIVRFISATQSQHEEIRILRESKNALPEIVIRETIANIMVHQDLLDRSFNPMVELFEGILSASNPGKLLVDVARVIDTVPVCRNEILSRSMRQLRMIEDRGSGFDRIEECLASHHFPAAKVVSDDFSTKIILSSKSDFAEFDEEEALLTIYTYCCYGYINLSVSMNNAFFRERLGLKEKDAPSVSRLLTLAMSKHLIKLREDSTGMRNRSYIPYWA